MHLKVVRREQPQNVGQAVRTAAEKISGFPKKNRLEVNKTCRFIEKFQRVKRP
jgi:hypothetical protein